MFVINIYLKLALIFICTALGIGLTAAYGFWYGFPFILTGIILLGSYLMLGTVTSSAQLIQESDFDGAEKRLNLTLNPRLLYVTNRAFYYILKGSILMNKQDNNGAESFFQKALNLKLPSDNEKAMVLLQLANINAQKNKWNTAQKYFKDAEKLKVTEGQMKDQMTMFRKAMKNRGQAKLAGRMGKQGHQMMNRGSKRRRPKMR
jgi:tetratricopeptide (TPR) repeat protein